LIQFKQWADSNYAQECVIKYLTFIISHSVAPSYAEPPVGDRRLRPSEPVQPWKGTLEATRGVICPQHPPRFTPPHLERSEDCLVVNIWTPANATPKSKLPVLVFIHGGAFYVGSGLDNYANPHNLTQVRRVGSLLVQSAYNLFRTT
jgi:para-nitrobenzyl esterase